MYASGKYSKAICDRCSFKYDYKDLVEDENVPGLWVCQDGCKDKINPYKLPPRQADAVALHHPRPDIPLRSIGHLVSDSYGTYLVDENGNYLSD